MTGDGGRLIPEAVEAQWREEGLISAASGLDEMAREATFDVNHDLSTLPWTGADSPATVNVTTRRKCRRHEWEGAYTYSDGRVIDVENPRCLRCGAIKNPAVSRTNRGNHPRGNAKERAWCRRLAFDHVGQFKGIADGQDAMFIGQLKTRATGSFPGWMTDELDKLAKLGTGKTPILGVVESPGPGRRERRLVVVDEADWIALHVGEKS